MLSIYILANMSAYGRKHSRPSGTEGKEELLGMTNLKTNLPINARQAKALIESASVKGVLMYNNLLKQDCANAIYYLQICPPVRVG